MRYAASLLFWILSDLLLFIGAYAFAYFLKVGWIFSSDFPFTLYITAVALVAPLWLLVLLTTRAFGLTRKQFTIRNFAYVGYSCVVGTALFTLTYYFLFGLFFSRLLLLEALILSVLVIWIWHVIFEQLLRGILRRDPPVFPTLIVGVTRESKELIRLLNSKKNPLTPVAILDATGAKEADIDGVPVLGKLNKLEEVLQQKKITHLIQCSDLEQSINLLSACRNRGIAYGILPSVLGIVEHDEHIESLEGKPITIVDSRISPLHWFFR